MSLFKAFLRTSLAAATFAAAATLSACSGLTPVYSDSSAAQAMALQFADPKTPLEQIVYQDLGRRFGMSDNPDAPQVSVSVSTYSRALTQSVTTDPAESDLLTATGILRITRNGNPITMATRQATATYTVNNQVIADTSAQQAAAEQAAHALADTLQLTIISALTPAAPTPAQ